MLKYRACDRRAVTDATYARNPMQRKTAARLLVPCREDPVPRGQPAQAVQWAQARQRQPQPPQQRAKKAAKAPQARLAGVAPGIFIANEAAHAALQTTRANTAWVDVRGMADGHVPYRDWCRIVSTALDQAAAARAARRDVVVFCKAGVNRSASVVSAILMASQGLAPDQAAQAIERAKAPEYGQTWDTLTNASFRHYLRQWHHARQRASAAAEPAASQDAAADPAASQDAAAADDDDDVVFRE